MFLKIYKLKDRKVDLNLIKLTFLWFTFWEIIIPDVQQYLFSKLKSRKVT